MLSRKNKKYSYALTTLLIIGVFFIGFLVGERGSKNTPLYKEYEMEVISYDFNIKFFEEALANHPTEVILGKTMSEEDAVKKALLVWEYMYSDEDIYFENPIKVYFVSDLDAWYLHGSLPDGADGGTPEILIRKSDGKVLAVWYSY